jgi:hypothetical protein
MRSRSNKAGTVLSTAAMQCWIERSRVSMRRPLKGRPKRPMGGEVLWTQASMARAKSRSRRTLVVENAASRHRRAVHGLAPSCSEGASAR